jgi:hypothetical protein
MELRCPKCNSTDLKKVSLAHEDGLFRTEAKTRMRAAVVGGSGADLIVGRASTRGVHESVLAKKLRPPTKWSYRKLCVWSALLFLCGGWLIFYVNTVAKNASSVVSPVLTTYALIAGVVFVLILGVALRHNHLVYAKRFAEWHRSFMCQRCGSLFDPI